MAWRWSVCGTAEVVWKPRFLWQWPSAHLHFLVSCFSFSSWQYPIYSLWGSGLVSLLASQAHQHHSFNQLLVLLAVWAGAKSCWKMKSASLKSWSAEGSMKCSKMYVTLVFKKHSGPTPADDIAPQIITDCGNLTLDFKQLGLWASPPFLQTLGPWFPNEIQNLLSSEKRTLDHWATVQFFFLAQLRRLWWQL